MKKIVLISRFNTNNIGDIVIANTLKRDLSQIGNVECISLFGRPKTQMNMNKIIRYAHKNLIPKLFKNAIRKVQNELFLRLGIKEKSIIVLGGGNMMVDVNTTTRSANRYVPYIKAAKPKNCMLIALDIGIGPFCTDRQRKAAIDILNNMDFISFRDRSSQKIYEEARGISPHCISIDPAFFYRSRVEEKTLSVKRRVGINLLNLYLVEYDKKYVTNVLRGYQILGEMIAGLLGAEIYFYITDEADIPFLEEIANFNFKEKCYVKYIEGVKDLLAFYDEMDVIVGTRMHSMILAYSRRTPCVGLKWQQKVEDLFLLLESGDKLFPFDDLVNKPDKIILAISKIYDNYELEQKHITNIYRKLNEIRVISYKDFTQIVREKLNEN